METLLSLKEILKGENLTTAFSDVNVQYLDPINQTIDVRNISVVYFGSRWEVSAQTIGKPTDETIQKYVEIQNFIGNCVRLAEILNSKLLRICKSYLNKSASERKEIQKYDFMKLRGVFSDYLKRYERIKNLEEYNSNQKIKNLTKLFYQFVLDRNIYTHGVLRMRKPENDFVLSHKKDENNTYSLVTKEILISFMKIYEILYKLLDDFIFTKQNENI